MYQRILVTTDGSKLSQKAIATAIKLAGLTGAELVALKVVQRYPQSYFEGGMALVGEDVKQVEKTWGDAAQKVVNAVKKTAEDAGIKTKAVVVRSDVVSDAILSTIKKQGCDLVVMASHGRKGIKRLLLGSETQHVLTHATVPVLVLK
ncbi:UspA Universal stress protein UspA and related nucleotide-binding proteins [Comamonadaceae bacterium]|jgi:nucleotide-binding universal stress UspA family protein|uniref:universal stress protein n=1 Tax=Rhodoferax potami TaxID=3068338 RepID=UPI0028BF166D|nr:universal stress protein [Rhodoferax sp. TBRC 17198]MDT7522332.1 universal stress protein [Rhodoferax sp. TBRC 17198]